MKLTKASDYALILLSHLTKLEPDTNTSVKRVAMICGVPERFLAIIVHRLSTSGLVRSIKGMKGGIRLGRPGSEITLRDVVEAMEGPISFVECQKQIGLCSLEENCLTKPFWDAVHDKMLMSLSATSIVDLARFMPDGVNPLISSKTRRSRGTKRRLKEREDEGEWSLA